MANRRAIKKDERLKVYEKYGGKCAYCGRDIELADMQVDHFIALESGGADSMENYMPTCRMCNHYKRANSLEGWRKMLETIPDKLARDSYIYRVGIVYGNIVANQKPIKFYYETQGKGELDENIKVIRELDENSKVIRELQEKIGKLIAEIVEKGGTE